MAEYILKTANRYRPHLGWLAFCLLLSTLASLLLAVTEVDWAPGSWVIIPMVLLGFLLTHWLAHQALRPAVAWLLIVTAGVALAIFFIARLWPSSAYLSQATSLTDALTGLPQFWRQQLALFVDRLAGWYRAVTSGSSSTETIPFVLGLALVGWFLAAFLNWSAYRWRQPILGLTLVGIGLALNTFYGGSGLYWVVMFVGLAITAYTYLDYCYREETWDQTGVDYSAEARTDLLVYVAGVSIAIMTLAMAIPAINVRAIAEAFQRQSAIVEAEQTLQRAFGGVSVSRPATPRTDEGAPDPTQLPRGFLLGYPPELAETAVMTATVEITGEQVNSGDPRLEALHWRSINYEVYTGQGWERSTTEREEFFPAGSLIPPPEIDALPDEQLLTLSQAVDWTFDNRRTRYTLGQPLRFSHDVAVYWRGRADMIGVQGRNNPPRRYTASSQVALPAEEILLSARLEDVPPEIMARYTLLPETVPERVIALAQQVGGLAVPENESGVEGQETPTPLTAGPTPYEQARAIESFLHQYPYTLDVTAPPPNVDMVDYFLFDLQRGYCDYFASAMVVMARAIGLPARLATGYLQQPADERGVQTIRQANAHSWTEIYFAGIGWVEFEPTPPFAVTEEPAATPTLVAGDIPPVSATIQPVAIPEREAERTIPWYFWLGILLLLAMGYRLWGRRWIDQISSPRIPLDEVQLAFAQLQDSAADLRYPIRAGQTPLEFAAGLNDYLRDTLPPTQPDRAVIFKNIEQLTTDFNARQYGQSSSATPNAETATKWRNLRRSLRRQIWRQRLEKIRIH